MSATQQTSCSCLLYFCTQIYQVLFKEPWWCLHANNHRKKMIWLTVDPNQKKENALIKGSGRARELHEAWKKKDVLVSLWAWTFVGKNFLTAEQTAPLHRSRSVFSLSAGLGCKTTFFHAWPETVLSPNTEACSLEDRAGRRRGTLLMCKHPVRGSALI